jgi:tetratricopeptide (TPR) repeat protein
MLAVDRISAATTDPSPVPASSSLIAPSRGPTATPADRERRRSRSLRSTARRHWTRFRFGIAELLDRAASYFHRRAAYSEGRSLFQRALAISEKVLGPEHPDTAMSLNNLALLLKDQGDLAAARPLFERALAISEKVPDPEHPATAKVRNNLARLLNATV